MLSIFFKHIKSLKHYSKFFSLKFTSFLDKKLENDKKFN